MKTDLDRRFTFERLGFSYRVGELEGALGLAQIERKDEIMDARHKNAEILNGLLEPYEKWLQLPKDILLGASIITLMGNQELRVENYKSILDYREDYILLQAKKYRIQIKGRKLQIAYYTKDEMKICGYYGSKLSIEYTSKEANLVFRFFKKLCLYYRIRFTGQSLH